MKSPSAKDIERDRLHKLANGKVYSIKAGLLIEGVKLRPRAEAGCKCVTRPIVKGFD